jgi:D-sedoheptulose 7-phosphate isomerase
MDSLTGQFIERYLQESEAALHSFAVDQSLHEIIAAFADLITGVMRGGGKLLIAGNGGSAGDAQHMAGEFVSRLFFDHAPLAAVALTTDTSVLTAIGNDYGYEKVFERQVLGLGKAGDAFLGISTSGKSPNILRALSAARSNGLKTLGFAGVAPGPMDELCDIILHAPSPKTAVIQQIHITAVHLVCGLVEKNMFAEKP